MNYLSNIKYELTFTECNGFKMPFKTFESIDYKFWPFIPDNIEDHLEDMKNVEIREDDVIICTYPRSGTNWTNEIVRMLLEGSAEYTDFFLEFLDAMPRDKIAEVRSPRLFISHFPFQFLPKQLAEKGRIICVFRNPKDLAVSLYQLMKKAKFAEMDGTFSDFLPVFYNGDLPGGSWSDHVLAWEQVINNKSAKALLPIYYEDLKKDQRSQVNKIAEFLGVPYNDELFSNIVTQCEFTNLSKHKKANVPELIYKLSRDKSNYLYWKGQTGGWKNWFTVAQNEEFDNFYKAKMKNSNLSFSYEI